MLLHAVQPALTLALIGSVNGMVASLVADSLTRTRHKPNQELVGQGIGNVAAGIVGGAARSRRRDGNDCEHPGRGQ